MKARDGVTDIYGMIIRPSNYDPSRKYPVLDAIYPGPQIIRTPKAFPGAENAFWQDQALAELGFIVITIDGLGTPFRSRQMIDVATGAGFGEAGGLEDHVAGITQLSERDPSLDLDRVGIYGHSGGGYASTRAMLLFPDFYKAAVSSAGNHDNLGYVALWGEAWVGLYDAEIYAHQDNIRLAGEPEREAAADPRRDGRQRAPVADDAHGRRADRRQQRLRDADHAEHEPRHCSTCAAV